MKTIKTVMGAALLGLTVSALAAPAGMGKGNDGMGGMRGMGSGGMMYKGEGAVTMPMLRQHMGMMHQQMQNMPMNGDSEAWEKHREQMMEQMEQHMEMMQQYQEQTESPVEKSPKE